MHWHPSDLSQCSQNTPTMIFEGWNLHFLLPAHAVAHELTLAHLDEVLFRRRLLQARLCSVQVHMWGSLSKRLRGRPHLPCIWSSLVHAHQPASWQAHLAAGGNMGPYMMQGLPTSRWWYHGST